MHTLLNLHKRMRDIVTVCPMCGRGDESDVHLLIECEYGSLLGSVGVLIRQMMWRMVVSWLMWVECLHDKGRDDAERVMIIL